MAIKRWRRNRGRLERIGGGMLECYSRISSDAARSEFGELLVMGHGSGTGPAVAVNPAPESVSVVTVS